MAAEEKQVYHFDKTEIVDKEIQKLATQLYEACLAGGVPMLLFVQASSSPGFDCVTRMMVVEENGTMPLDVCEIITAAAVVYDVLGDAADEHNGLARLAAYSNPCIAAAVAARRERQKEIIQRHKDKVH